MNIIVGSPPVTVSNIKVESPELGFLTCNKWLGEVVPIPTLPVLVIRSLSVGEPSIAVSTTNAPSMREAVMVSATNPTLPI